jgi:hypothetical protein
MNWSELAEPKNSWIAASDGLGVDQVVRHRRRQLSW